MDRRQSGTNGTNSYRNCGEMIDPHAMVPRIGPIN
jgi:hypothetical protein